MSTSLSLISQERVCVSETVVGLEPQLVASPFDGSSSGPCTSPVKFAAKISSPTVKVRSLALLSWYRYCSPCLRLIVFPSCGYSRSSLLRSFLSISISAGDTPVVECGVIRYGNKNPAKRDCTEDPLFSVSCPSTSARLSQLTRWTLDGTELCEYGRFHYEPCNNPETLY